jgi:hypothetical protein
MATQLPEGSKGMIERIKRLLLSPAAEWAAIDTEPMTVKGIFMTWVVPLAAIGPVALLIGGMIFGYGFWHPPLSFFLTLAITTYVMSLVGTFVTALVIDNLAPSFGAQKNMVTATKVAAFSWTAAWVAGVVNIIPMLGILAIVGAYSLYLLWIGLPLLMKPAADKAVTYFVAVLVVCVVVMVVANYAARSVTYSAIGSPFALSSVSGDAGTVSVPGVGSVNLGALTAAGEKMKAASAQMQADAASGHSSAVPADALQGMLPASIAGFSRGDVETQSGGAGGINGSKAEARYTQGEQSFRLSVADVGALGSIATLGGAMNLQSSKTTATGYEKTQMVDGAMVSERWDNQDHSGAYSTMVASRFAVDASGNAPSIDILKQAVAAIDTSKLAGLAK